MTSSPPRSDAPVDDLIEYLRDLGPEAAVRVARAMWRDQSIVDQAAIAWDWAFWARSKQLPPPGAWRTWGFLTGRGFGKTIALSKFIHDEVEAGRAQLICLLAQDEQSAIDLQVNGPSGLIATAPPWFKPVFEASALQLVWPNGARAYVRTPEVPGKIRGLEYQLTWASELQSWPKATREEALDNVFLSTRLGYARVVWDATPKKRHPLLKRLLAKHEAEPAKHVVVRGTTYENASNLGDGYVDDLEKEFAGTTRGREEMGGEMVEDADGALWRQAWIDEKRRAAPQIVFRVVSVDPAVSDRPGSDTTGIVDVGRGVDDRAYVFADASGKHKPEAWATIVLDWYARGADCVIVERNKGGDLVAQNLRSAAKERGLEVIVIGKDERVPPRQAGKVFVKEVYARGDKAERAAPVATAYQRGRVSHVSGHDLASLEDTLTTWEPPTTGSRKDSPGDLDALVHAVVDVLGLSNNEVDPKAGFVGLEKAAQELRTPQHTSSIAHLFQTGRGDRI